jgi:hypothetical protein
MATVAFFASYYVLTPTFGNTALWFSFIIWLLMRGILLYFGSHKLDADWIIDKVYKKLT